MDWSIWLRKLCLGLLTTVAAAGVAYLVSQVEALQTAGVVSPWLLLLAPVVLHGLGLIGNLIKHIG